MLIQNEAIVSDLIKIWKNSSAAYYDMIVNGKVVPKNKTLSEAGISETSKYELKDRRTRISFGVKTQYGSVFRVVLYPSDTILDVKEQIEVKGGIPIDHQRIIFGGRQLCDEMTLCERRIKNGSELFLVLSLRG